MSATHNPTRMILTSAMVQSPRSWFASRLIVMTSFPRVTLPVVVERLGGFVQSVRPLYHRGDDSALDESGQGDEVLAGLGRSERAELLADEEGEVASARAARRR